MFYNNLVIKVVTQIYNHHFTQPDVIRTGLRLNHFKVSILYITMHWNCPWDISTSCLMRITQALLKPLLSCIEISEINGVIFPPQYKPYDNLRVIKEIIKNWLNRQANPLCKTAQTDQQKSVIQYNDFFQDESWHVALLLWDFLSKQTSRLPLNMN